MLHKCKACTKSSIKFKWNDGILAGNYQKNVGSTKKDLFIIWHNCKVLNRNKYDHTSVELLLIFGLDGEVVVTVESLDGRTCTLLRCSWGFSDVRRGESEPGVSRGFRSKSGGERVVVLSMIVEMSTGGECTSMLC